MSELNFKMGTKTSTVPSSGTSGEVFFTTDENKYGHIYFIDRKNKIINVIPNLLDIAHGGTGATTAATALTNLGLTATATELNYVKGATSSLQTQLNNKSEKNHTHDYLSLNGGAITGKMDLTSFPNVDDNYKMGKTSGASGGIHFKKKDGQNDYGNAITWSHSNNDESHAGIYVKSSGSYGTKMYLATTSSFSAGAMAALEIDHAGNISALRGNFKGDLIGNASTATTASSLKYHSTLQTDEAIDGFLEANALKSAIWGSTSSPGTSNGIIISGGYASTNYGFQLAIDDDPTYFMALRQKGTNGWNEWKRIPMADGTGASGTWGIGITGNASTATKATQDASGNTITSTYATKSELNTAKSALQTSIDSVNTIATEAKNVEIGGRNLLRKYIQDGLRTSKIDDLSIKIGTSSTAGDTYFYLKASQNLKAGALYTISCDASNVPSGTSWSFGVGYSGNSNFVLCINKNGRCYASGKLNSDVAAGSTILIDDSNGNVAANINIVLSNFKLEIGGKATDYTPSVEDIQESIDNKLPLSGGTMTGSIIMPKNDNMGIIPDTNNYGQIGSADKKFYRMYSTNYYGDSAKFDKSLETYQRYNLGAHYNYTNGCLIEIGTARNTTMCMIHITGNSYDPNATPIDSLYQFYDWSDGIIHYTGISLGYNLGAMTVYRYDGKLYAYIKQTRTYQTLSFELITNKTGLIPKVTNAVAHTNGYTHLVTITPENVSVEGHTHSYAGSSSAGGAANAVAGGVGQSNVYRHVWFSDNNTETVRNYDDDFKYNPSTNTLSVANLSGNASSATKATQDGSGNTITSTYATKTELNTTKSNLQSSIDGKLSLSGGTMTGSIILPTNDDMGIIPSTNNYGQIGSSDKQFYRMYAKNFYGSLQGNATSATSATKATQDASGNVITSTYETKTDSSSKLATAKAYADNVATTAANKVKNDLLNGAGGAYDTLKELGDLIDDNTDAIDALEIVATNKADKSHTHTVVNGVTPEWSGSVDSASYFGAWTEDGSKIKALPRSKASVGSLCNPNGSYIKTAADMDSFIKAGQMQYATFQLTEDNGLGFNNKDGVLLSIPWDSSNYGVQVAFDDSVSDPRIAMRAKANSWGSWKNVAMGDGTGASGTWGINISGNATTATTATNIKDYNGDYKIQIGYNGGGISGDQIAYIAGYTNSNGIKIKDVSKSALQSWLGLGSAAYTASTAYATSGHTHNYAGSSSAGGSATSAVKLDTTTAGSATQPAYFSGGKPVACTYTLGKSVPSNAVFTDTTYSAATQSAQGLMSAADKKKLDGIASGANAYSLPTASSSTLGGVKTTSTVTSTSGLTACPIISGVPYYKDTNTTYSLSSFGITATAAELNYTDGVTSNIQTQLNGKVDLTSAQTVSGVKKFSNGIKIGNATLTYDSTNKRMVISVT